MPAEVCRETFRKRGCFRSSAVQLSFPIEQRTLFNANSFSYEVTHMSSFVQAAATPAVILILAAAVLAGVIFTAAPNDSHNDLKLLQQCIATFSQGSLRRGSTINASCLDAVLGSRVSRTAYADIYSQHISALHMSSSGATQVPRVAVVMVLAAAAAGSSATTGAAGAPYYARSLQNKVRYCKRHGYDLHVFNGTLDASRSVSWSKLLAVHRAMWAGYDWVWSIDADTLVMNPEVRLEAILGISQPRHAAIVPVDCRGPNGGECMFGMIQQGAWYAPCDDKKGVFYSTPTSTPTAFRVALAPGITPRSI